MIENVKVRGRRTIVVDVTLALLSLSLVSMLRIMFLKPSVRNRFGGATGWGWIMVCWGMLLIVSQFAAGEASGSQLFWMITLWFLPLIIFGVGLWCEKKNHVTYTGDVDNLLSLILVQNVIRKNELSMSIRKSQSLVKINDPDYVNYILRDLQACGVLTFSEERGEVRVVLLMPLPIGSIKAEEAVPVREEPLPRWTCGCCGAENTSATCEYCGGKH